MVGTSGSTDYLRDAAPDVKRPTAADRRFWPVSVPLAELARCADDGFDRQDCDGLHDEGAPPQYLCTRCFPDLRGDLAALEEDEYDERARDEAEEIV